MSRILSLVMGLAILSMVFVPVAQAQSQLNVKSVGEIFIDAAGRADGENLEGLVVEANGVISAYTSTALGMRIFDSVQIEGFSQAQKIQGVGSSEVVLRGSNAVVRMTDDIHSSLRISATADATVNYRLGGDVKVTPPGHAQCMSTDCSTVPTASAKHRLDVISKTGVYLGSLVIVGAQGEASQQSQFVTGAAGEVKAQLEAGAQVVFNARPVYVDSRSYSDATADATAKGQLVANVVTEFSGSHEAKSEANYYTATRAETDVSARDSVTTKVYATARASAMVAYDLAWETLPAQSTNDVAVFVNGEAATRVDSAGDVQAAAKQGITAYYAMASGGRTQVLASTPDFQGTATHTVTVATSAAAAAKTETQAKSEAKARSSSSIFGEITYYANGKLTGEFMSGIVSRQDASVHDYTSIDTQTEVFDSFTVDGDTFSEVRAEGHTVHLTGANADLTMVDDAYATLLVSAKQQTSVVFDLSANVQATVEGHNLVHLEGPNGYVGTMVIANAQAQASSNVAATSRFVADAQGEVKALLDANSRLVLMSESNAKASGEASGKVIAEAIAQGKVAGHVLAGLEGGAAATSSVEYYATVLLQTTAEAKGSFAFDFQSHTSAVMVFESRGQALAAQSAEDIQVLVNGKAATAVSSVEAALTASARAKYYAETTLDGQVRVLVNAGADARTKANVVIESTLESRARAEAGADAFGTFKMYEGGLAIGELVSLRVDQTAGVINDFTMLSTGTEVFSSVQAGASAFVSSGAEGASVLLLENREAKLEFSDTTNAYMRLAAKAETEVNYRLAAGMQAAAQTATVVEVTSETGAYLGSMIITDAEGKAAHGSEFAVDAQGQVQAHLEAGAQIIFRTHVGIEQELSAAERALMNQAIAAGHVGGQVLVQTQASLSAAAHAAVQAQASAEANAEANADAVIVGAAEHAGHVTTAVTTSYYQDVQLVTAAMAERVDVTVSSTLTAGKTVIVSLDPATVTGMLTGHAVIEIDGKLATQASGYADILNPNDDAGVYEYFVLAGEAGTQVLVSLPHFSTHSVTLKNAEPSTPPVFMYATIFLGVIVAAETVVLVRNRRMA